MRAIGTVQTAAAEVRMDALARVFSKSVDDREPGAEIYRALLLHVSKYTTASHTGRTYLPYTVRNCSVVLIPYGPTAVPSSLLGSAPQ